MKAAYAIHEIVVSKERITPKTVIELEDEVFAELEGLGAVREAEADEISIAGLSKPAPVKAPAKTAAEKKAEAAAAKAAEEAAAAKAAEVAPTVDPDETDADLLGNK